MEYHPHFIETLENRQLEEVLAFEAMRIVLKHPYLRRREPAELAYAASNLTLQEYLETSLPFPRARDVFGHDEFNKQYYEFYYQQLADLAPTVHALLPDASVLDLLAIADATVDNKHRAWDTDELRVDSIHGKIRTAHETTPGAPLLGATKADGVAQAQAELPCRPGRSAPVCCQSIGA